MQKWTNSKKKEVLDAHFEGRTDRWQKVGRALENAFVRFEIVMNIGAYRDLHRHRMHTQERQRFTTAIGYETVSEIRDFELVSVLDGHMSRVRSIFSKIGKHDPQAAQDVVTMFHFVRFYQFQNMRAFFWEVELRTIEQGHPDYRWVEQQKFRLIKEVYPLLAPYVLVDMNDYGLARRGDEDRSAQKEKRITDGAKT